MDPKAEVAPNREPLGGAQKAGRQDHPIRVELQRRDLGRGEIAVAVTPALLQCLTNSLRYVSACLRRRP